MRRNRNNFAVRRRGYVLILVLVVLAIAGSVMAGTAAMSCRKAALANEAMRDLQLRWGSLSCRDLCLSNARGLLGSDMKVSSSLPNAIVSTVKLGDITFNLVLADEQCKVSINKLATTHDESSLRAAIATLQGGSAKTLSSEPAIATVRNVGTNVQEGQLIYASFDQVFKYDTPEDLMNLQTPLSSPVSKMTCWTNGKMNFKRASTELMEILCGGNVSSSDISKLRQLVGENADYSLETAISEASLPTGRSDRIGEFLTDTSSCHSLWVIAENSRRRWYYLYVAQGEHRPGNATAWSFYWP